MSNGFLFWYERGWSPQSAVNRITSLENAGIRVERPLMRVQRALVRVQRPLLRVERSPRLRHNRVIEVGRFADCAFESPDDLVRIVVRAGEIEGFAVLAEGDG